MSNKALLFQESKSLPSRGNVFPTIVENALPLEHLDVFLEGEIKSECQNVLFR